MIFTVCAEVQPDELQTEPHARSEDQEMNHDTEVSHEVKQTTGTVGQQRVGVQINCCIRTFMTQLDPVLKDSR